MRKARIALARRLAIIMHAMLRDGTEFVENTIRPELPYKIGTMDGREATESGPCIRCRNQEFRIGSFRTKLKGFERLTGECSDAHDV
jgi:hypothetical protein